METAKVALVTGASSGIGQATAVELARCGYQVAIHYFNNDAGARDTFEQIRGVQNGRARVYACDVCDAAQVGQMAGDIQSDFGRVDVLVNNAGSLVERRLLSEMDYDLWRRVMAVNLDSVFLVTRAFLPRMMERGGSIVNVASIAGRHGGGPGAAAYAAAKGAIITLTKGMAKEFIPFGIRVNCVNPGVISTPFHERFSSKELFQKFVSAIPQQRAGTSAEVAKVIAFLISEESSHVVGECLEVNGGMLMD